MKSLTTKKQRERLYSANTGYGWIAFKTGEKEITEIEIYVGRDNVLRRVGNGKPLFPLQIVDAEEGLISIQSR